MALLYFTNSTSCSAMADAFDSVSSSLIGSRALAAYDDVDGPSAANNGVNQTNERKVS